MAEDNRNYSEENESLELQYLRVHERYRFVRLIVVCVTILVALGLIVSGVVELAAQPTWITVVLAIVGPTGTIVVLIKMFRQYIKRTHSRVKSLENQVDPERTTSGLRRDGSSSDGL